jgi:hypothetical protein
VARDVSINQLLNFRRECGELALDSGVSGLKLN